MMKRRTFLKLAASAAVVAASQLAMPWAASAATESVSFAGALYRGGGRGKVETSTDGGRSWALHSDLGDMYTITNLAVVRRGTRLRLTVGYRGSTFPLVLGRDKRSWHTV